MATSTKPDIDSPFTLTADQIAKFRQDGYIKIKDVLTPDVIDYYGPLITSEVHRLNKMHLPIEQRDTYNKAFLQVGNIWCENETIKEFCWGKRLARMAKELLGVTGVRMYHDQALYKEAGGGVTPWHADQYYWPLSNANTVTAWIPLQATPMELGPLAFAKGSHKFGWRDAMDLVVIDKRGAEATQCCGEGQTRPCVPCAHLTLRSVNWNWS